MGSAAGSRVIAALTALALACVVAVESYGIADGRSTEPLAWTLFGGAIGAICGCVLLLVRRRREPRLTSKAVFVSGLVASVGGQLLFRATSGSGSALGSALGFLLAFSSVGAYGSARRIRQRSA
jgi:hypothetical protein